MGNVEHKSPSILDALHVLFVDSSPDERDLFRLRLEQHRAVVATAATPWQALGILEQGDTDVLVTDVLLPEISGQDLVQMARSNIAGGEDSIPTIAVTGFARTFEVEDLQRSGFDAVLVKPYDTEDLIAMISGLAARIESTREVRARTAEKTREQQALRKQLAARRQRLERERIELTVRHGAPDQRASAVRSLIEIVAREYAEAYFGDEIDEIEFVSHSQTNGDVETWSVCVTFHSRLLVLDISVDATAKIVVHRHGQECP